VSLPGAVLAACFASTQVLSCAGGQRHAGSPHDHNCCCPVADCLHAVGAGSAAAAPDAEARLRPVVIAALAAGLLAGYGIAMPVGAVAAYLVAFTARTSMRTGVMAALGVATADGLYGLIAVCGRAALAPVLRPVALPMRWGSAVVLIALAVHGTITAIRRHRERQDGTRTGPAPYGAARAFLGMWGMTMMNPLTVVYFSAIVLGRQTAVAPRSADQAAFVLAVFVASASWQLALAGGGAFLGRMLTGSCGRLLTAIASSLLVGGLAVHLLTATP
jgi:threonine/homoserine/homoserine lactone efflux protein